MRSISSLCITRENMHSDVEENLWLDREPRLDGVRVRSPSLKGRERCPAEQEKRQQPVTKWDSSFIYSAVGYMSLFLFFFFFCPWIHITVYYAVYIQFLFWSVEVALCVWFKFKVQPLNKNCSYDLFGKWMIGSAGKCSREGKVQTSDEGKEQNKKV